MTGVPEDAFRAHIEGEALAELARIHADCTRIDSEANAKGMFHSGRRMLLISNAYLEGARRHRRTLFEVWSTYIKPHIDAANVAACQGLAIDAFDSSLKAIALDHDRHLARAGGALMQATTLRASPSPAAPPMSVPRSRRRPPFISRCRWRLSPRRS